MEQQQLLIPENAAKIVAEAVEYAGTIREITISTNTEYESSGEVLKEINGYIKMLENERKNLKAPVLERGRLIDNYFKTPTTALSNAKKVVDIAMVSYQRAKAEEARKEQARLNAQAEELRRKEAEKARIEAEKAAAYREQGREDMAKKAEARQAYREESAEMIVAPVVETAPPKIEGITTRKNWKGLVTEPRAFVQWAAENKRYELLKPNDVAYNAYARMIQREEKVPGGIVTCKEKTVGSR